MLAVNSMLSTRGGTLLSALIVVLCIVGLTMHRDFYACRIRKDFFCFYTNLSNLVVLIYFAVAAPWLYQDAALHPLIAHAEFAVMMEILLTFAVFHLVLFPAVRKTALCMERTREYMIVCADNLFIHYLVPLSVFVYWLLFSPGKSSLRAGDALYWTALPVVYAVFIFLRAPLRGVIEEAGSPYPYPFMDIQTLGMRRVMICCASLYTISVLAGLGIIMIIRIIFT